MIFKVFAFTLIGVADGHEVSARLGAAPVHPGDANANKSSFVQLKVLREHAHDDSEATSLVQMDHLIAKVLSNL